MADDFQYRVGVDDSAALKALRNIDRHTEQLAKRGQAHFDRIGKSARLSGVQIGLTSGIVSELTRNFLDLGRQAIGVLERLGEKSVGLASALEITEKTFIGIFKGNEAAATAALDRIRAKSRELGVDLGETAATFLPFVRSLEELERVGKVAAALALAQPEQGAFGARIALQEALSGNVLSLVRRFEIPPEFADKLQEALDTGGVEAFLDTFEGVLTQTGRSLDTFADTFQLALGRAELQGQRLLTAFGGPITEALKESLGGLADIIEERGDDFEAIAAAFGDVVANVVEFVGSGLADFLQNLNTEDAIELADSFFELVESAKTFVEVINGANLPENLISGTKTLVDNLTAAITTLNQITLLAKAQSAREEAEAKFIAETVRKQGQEKGRKGLNNFLASAVESVPGLGQAALGLAETGIGGAEAEQQAAEARAAGQAASNAVLLEGVKATDESTRATEENREAQKKRREEQERGRSSQGEREAEADAVIAATARARELAQAQEAAAAAQEKINEQIEDAELDHQRKMDDIIQDGEIDRLGLLEKQARKRIDLATDNLREIEDIERKNSQAISDAATDLSRDEEDIARKASRRQVEAKKDAAKEQIKIEQDFQNEIQQIRTKFAQAAEDAERNRDAIAFIEAVRQRDREIEAAQEKRSTAVEEARTEASEKRTELNLQLEQELEDVRINNERKVEDLRLRLDRELEEQRLKNERAFEDNRIAEARQTEDFEEQLAQRIEAANLANSRKLADLEASLAAELEVVKKYEQLKTQTIAAEATERKRLEAGLDAEAQPDRGGRGSLSRRQRNRQLAATGPQFSFQDGGVVPGPIGQPVQATVHGGEVIYNPYRPTAQPLPTSLTNIRTNSSSFQFGDVNFGGGDRMDRFITYAEFLEMVQLLR